MNSCKEGRASTERTDYQPKTRSASLLPAPRRARRQPGSQYWPTRAAARASIVDKPRTYLPRLATYDASKPFIDDAKTALTRRAPYCQLSQTARSLATRSLAAQGRVNPREHEKREPPAQHAAGIASRIRGASWPNRFSDAWSSSDIQRAVVDSCCVSTNNRHAHARQRVSQSLSTHRFVRIIQQAMLQGYLTQGQVRPPTGQGAAYDMTEIESPTTRYQRCRHPTNLPAPTHRAEDRIKMASRRSYQ